MIRGTLHGCLILFFCATTSLAQNPSTIADRDPIPIGGMKEFNEYVTYYCTDHCPEELKGAGIYGKIYMAAKVDTAGVLYDFKIKKRLSTELESLAIQGINSFGKWKPGIKGGKKVEREIILPVKIEEEELIRKAEFTRNDHGNEIVLRSKEQEAGFYVNPDRLKYLYDLDSKQRIKGFKKEYYENERLKMTTFYKFGKKEGPCLAWYINGALKSEGHYEVTGDKSDDTSRYILDHSWTIDGTPMVQNGNGTHVSRYVPSRIKKDSGQYINGYKEGTWITFYDTVGTPLELGQYVAGKKNGEWKGYHPDGSVKYQENYDATGRLMEGISFGLNKEKVEYKHIHVTAVPKNGMRSFRMHLAQYIAKNYPTSAKKAGVQGEVVVQFFVDSMGKPVDFTIVNGIGHGCDETVINAIEKYGIWNPAKIRGQTLRTKLTMKVKFNLG